MPTQDQYDSPIYPDSREGVKHYLTLTWLPEYVRLVQHLVETGQAYWTPDDYNAGVWGLHVDGDKPNQVRAIVYLNDNDDESDELWLDEQAAKMRKGK